MKVKALRSFVGAVCMHIGEERELIDEKFAKELIAAGHVVEISDKKEVPSKPTAKKKR